MRTAPVVAVLTVAVLAPSPAALLDQSQTEQNGLGALSNTWSVWQTFTAGMSGWLDHVLTDADPYPTSLGGVVVTVELRDTAAGLPGGTVMASAQRTNLTDSRPRAHRALLACAMGGMGVALKKRKQK